MDSIDGIKMSINKRNSDSSGNEEDSLMAFTAQDVQGVVINEILPDPTGATDFDTDGDGTATAEDEFVEFFNTTGAPVDISGWTITDNIGVRFTFPPGTIIPAGGYVTVVGEWTGPLPPNTFEMGDNFFNDGGDIITLSDGTNSATASYGSASGGDDFGSDIDGLSIQRDPDGGMTFANDQPPTPGATNTCFLSDTRILIETGYKKIQNLKIGEKVMTVEGKLAPIKWISIQTINVDQPINPLRRDPVCFKKGSLAHNLPKRDLYTSPDHAMFVDGLLINAGALVNGVNIISTVPTDEFNYYHIELLSLIHI